MEFKASLYRNQEEAARTPKPCAVGVLGARPEACARVKIHIVSCQADHGWTVRKNSSEAVAWACFIAKRGPWLSRWDSCQDGGHQGGQGESLKVGSWMSWKISILRDCLSERSGMSKSMCIFQFLFVSLLFIFHLPVVVRRWYAQNSEANGKYWNIKRRQLEVGRTDIQHLGISKHCIDFVIFELCLWRKTGVSEDLWVYWYILTEDEIWKVRQSFYWTSHKGSYVNSTRVLAAVVVALSFYLPGNSSHEPSTQSESCQSWQWMMQTYLKLSRHGNYLSFSVARCGPCQPFRLTLDLFSGPLQPFTQLSDQSQCRRRCHIIALGLPNEWHICKTSPNKKHHKTQKSSKHLAFCPGQLSPEGLSCGVQ